MAKLVARTLLLPRRPQDEKAEMLRYSYIPFYCSRLFGSGKTIESALPRPDCLAADIPRHMRIPRYRLATGILAPIRPTASKTKIPI
jgi:hypothetical protein